MAVLTNEEKEITIKFSDLNRRTRRFLEKHLKTYRKIRVKEAYPSILGSQAPQNFTHDDAFLIEIVKLELDNKNFEQIPRANVNPEKSNIYDDIDLNGFTLAQLTILVVRMPNGKYLIIEGRTRVRVLRDLGVTNIIAEVFDYTGDMSKFEPNAVRFATFMNTQNKPYGQASVADVLKVIRYLITSGEIQLQADTIKGRAIFTQAVHHELNLMTAGKLKPIQWDTITHKALEQGYGYTNVISFPNGEGAQEYLEETLLGPEKIAEDLAKGIKYVVVASFIEKFHGRMVSEISKMNKSIKEIRMITHTGVPKSIDPEKDWITNVVKIKLKFDTHESQVSEVRFHGVRPDTTKITLFGGIPQVRSLEPKYLMNKLYIYK